MNKIFQKGFMKTAAHVLAELSFNSDTNEAQEQRQAFLEDSYAKERGEEPRNKSKAVKEESTKASNDPQHASIFNQ